MRFEGRRQVGPWRARPSSCVGSIASEDRGELEGYGLRDRVHPKQQRPLSPRIPAEVGLGSTFLPVDDFLSQNDEPKNGSRPLIPTQSDEMAIKQAIALPPLCGTEPYAVRTYERQSYVSSAIAELHISKLYYDRCRKLLQSNHFRVERKGIEPSTSALRRLGSVGDSIPSEVGRGRAPRPPPVPRDHWLQKFQSPRRWGGVGL